MQVTIEAGTPAGSDKRFCEWLEAHGVDPNTTFRVDVYGNGQMTVHQYALKDGRKFVIRTSEDMALAWRPVAGEAALREPFDVEVESMPITRAVSALSGFVLLSDLRHRWFTGDE